MSVWSSASGKPQLSYAERLRLRRAADNTGDSSASNPSSSDGLSIQQPTKVAPSSALSPTPSSLSISSSLITSSMSANSTSNGDRAASTDLLTASISAQPSEVPSRELKAAGRVSEGLSEDRREDIHGAKGQTPPRTRIQSEQGQVTAIAADASSPAMTPSHPTGQRSGSAPGNETADIVSPSHVAANAAITTKAPPINVWELRKKQKAEADAAAEAAAVVAAITRGTSSRRSSRSPERRQEASRRSASVGSPISTTQVPLPGDTVTSVKQPHDRSARSVTAQAADLSTADSRLSNEDSEWLQRISVLNGGQNLPAFLPRDLASGVRSSDAASLSSRASSPARNAWAIPLKPHVAADLRDDSDDRTDGNPPEMSAVSHASTEADAINSTRPTFQPALRVNAATAEASVGKTRPGSRNKHTPKQARNPETAALVSSDIDTPPREQILRQKGPAPPGDLKTAVTESGHSTSPSMDKDFGREGSAVQTESNGRQSFARGSTSAARGRGANRGQLSNDTHKQSAKSSLKGADEASAPAARTNKSARDLAESVRSSWDDEPIRPSKDDVESEWNFSNSRRRGGPSPSTSIADSYRRYESTNRSRQNSTAPSVGLDGYHGQNRRSSSRRPDDWVGGQPISGYRNSNNSSRGRGRHRGGWHNRFESEERYAQSGDYWERRPSRSGRLSDASMIYTNELPHDGNRQAVHTSGQTAQPYGTPLYFDGYNYYPATVVDPMYTGTVFYPPPQTYAPQPLHASTTAPALVHSPPEVQVYSRVPEEMHISPSDSPADRLVRQVEFYFSPENLSGDFFLRQQMDSSSGWVPITLIASFKRIRKLSEELGVALDDGVVRGRIQQSHHIEMDDEQRRLRKKVAWRDWVIPDLQEVNLAPPAPFLEQMDQARSQHPLIGYSQNPAMWSAAVHAPPLAQSYPVYGGAITPQTGAVTPHSIPAIIPGTPPAVPFTSPSHAILFKTPPQTADISFPSAQPNTPFASSSSSSGRLSVHSPPSHQATHPTPVRIHHSLLHEPILGLHQQSQSQPQPQSQSHSYQSPPHLSYPMIVHHHSHQQPQPNQQQQHAHSTTPINLGHPLQFPSSPHQALAHHSQQPSPTRSQSGVLAYPLGHHQTLHPAPQAVGGPEYGSLPQHIIYLPFDCQAQGEHTQRATGFAAGQEDDISPGLPPGLAVPSVDIQQQTQAHPQNYSHEYRVGLSATQPQHQPGTPTGMVAMASAMNHLSLTPSKGSTATSSPPTSFPRSPEVSSSPDGPRSRGSQDVSVASVQQSQWRGGNSGESSSSNGASNRFSSGGAPTVSSLANIAGSKGLEFGSLKATHPHAEIGITVEDIDGEEDDECLGIIAAEGLGGLVDRKK